MVEVGISMQEELAMCPFVNMSSIEYQVILSFAAMFCLIPTFSDSIYLREQFDLTVYWIGLVCMIEVSMKRS